MSKASPGSYLSLVRLSPLRARIALLIALFGIVFVVISSPRNREELGDAVQIALPLVGTGCAVASGDFKEYAARFFANMAIVHGLKNTLGERELNIRPRGSDRGFPSGHTAAAVYGASYVMRQCGGLVPYAGPILVASAGYVAGSRLDSDKHTLPQVFFGAVVGYASDRVLRKTKTRRRLYIWWLNFRGKRRIPKEITKT